MTASTLLAIILSVTIGLSACLGASAPPEARLTNQALRVKLYLPDSNTGFYRGTRFDWSGVIGSLEFAGHEFYPAWFQRTDPKVHDFIYEGDDIVAGPCTAITGPAEEFSTDGQGLGFDLGGAGSTFIKIGVGVLSKPDDRKYDPYRLYPIVDGGQWTIRRRSDAIEFIHVLADPASGYAYEYRKTVSLIGDQPRLVLDHALRNTGRRVLKSSVYNHNFLQLDRLPPGPDFTLKVPFKLRPTIPRGHDLAVVREHEISFAKVLTGEEGVYMNIEGFGAAASDYDFRVENRKIGAGVRITGDRPLSRVALWSIRAPLSIEPFLNMEIEPGESFTWRITYDYYVPSP